MPHSVLTSDTQWDLTFLNSPGNVKDKMWRDAQLSLSQGPSDKTFDGHGELRETKQNNVDAFDCDSYEDVDNLTCTCVEFHSETHNDNVCSCDSFFRCCSTDAHENFFLVTYRHCEEEF